MRGLQIVFQAIRPPQPRLQLPRRRRQRRRDAVPGGHAAQEPMPAVPFRQVPGARHAARGSAARPRGRRPGRHVVAGSGPDRLPAAACVGVALLVGQSLVPRRPVASAPAAAQRLPVRPSVRPRPFGSPSEAAAAVAIDDVPAARRRLLHRRLGPRTAGRRC
uniref:Uncharacterized protein n=1 Tax=Macrostomum lignano TaxID=282301 RepID=A0A1I8GRN3_9PLAT